MRAAAQRVATCLAAICFQSGSSNIVDVRPTPANRSFNSSLVDYIIEKFSRTILPLELGTLFSNCLPNTLDTTVLHAGQAETPFGTFWDAFVVTGDIPAMWLRDSMNQVQPYVYLLNASLAVGKSEAVLEHFLHGLLHRQASSVLVDAYANAYSWWGPKGQKSPNTGDETFKTFEPGGGKVNAMQDPRIYERKFEADSLLSVLKLASSVHALAPVAASHAFLRDPYVVPAVRRIFETLREMTFCNSTAYTFQRQSREPIDTLLHGVGTPCRDTGMVRTHFRPSDDTATFAFNVPANAMAAVELGRIGTVLEGLVSACRSERHSSCDVEDLNKLVRVAAQLEASVRQGLAQHGTMQFHGETVYAYEVDGFGNAIFMDDANIPSLLSLPLLGYVDAAHPLYQATRRLVLSEHNPWFSRGKLGIGGVGGPHVGAGMIWPMSLIVQAWTSSSVEEVSTLLRQLLTTATPNSLMHESFSKDSFSTFTRPWFAWANTLFGELVLKVSTDKVLYRAANLSRPVDLLALMRQWRGDLPQILV